ncbi:MAG: hypothetical protein C4518_06130 [Desulfobacteraceae bacterium]|nr:MAG: hypothetical protein C4518_06130 [Desulfobacteraceae bacterium]
MKKFLKSLLMLTLFSLAVLTAATTALADDVTDYIDEALKFYKDGKYTEAVDSLNFAEQLIQQKKSAGLEAFLPEPLKGWTAEAATSQAAGNAMMGGGISAERSYTKGDSSVKINIVADSPLLQGVMMMMGNPMFAASDGGKVERIGGQKAVIKYIPADKNGDIKIVVANRFLVTVEGNGITDADLKEYAKAIDYGKMATLP